MGAAAAIYLAFNRGSSAAHGWGIAISTDTAFALGLLTLFGRRAPDRLRAFMLTVVIADDLLALLVIALVYSDSIDIMPLIWAAGLFAVALGAPARVQSAARGAVPRARNSDVAGRRPVGHRAAGGGPRVRASGMGHARRPLGPRSCGKALPRVPRAAHA